MTAHAALESALNSAPSHWERRRFRFATHLRTEKNRLSDQPLLSVSAAHGVRERGEGGLGRQAPAEETIPMYWIVRPGDIVVNPMWVIEGGVAASTIAGAVSPAYRVYAPVSGVESRYLHHVLRSRPYIEQYKQYVRGVTTFDRAVSKEDFHELPVLLPPLTEQRRIADFLDAEISRIDKLRAARREQARLLDERLAALREQLFAQDSAARPVPLMYLTDPARPIVYGIVQAGPENPNGIPYIKTGDLPTLNPYKLSKTSPEIHAQFKRAAVRPGDIVMAMRASIGTVAVVPQDLPEANLTQGTARIAPANGVNVDWLLQALQTQTVLEQCNLRAVGTTFRTLNIWDLRRVVIPTISTAKQELLTSNFAEILAHYQRLRALTERQLRLLTERSLALVAAAVTGQIDVSTASGRGIED